MCVCAVAPVHSSVEHTNSETSTSEHNSMSTTGSSMVDEPAELDELIEYYESLMTADDEFEAALIQRDV